MDDLINEFAEVKVDKQLNALSVKFLGFVPYKDFMNIVENEYKLISLYHFRKCLVDLRLIPVYDQGMPEYIKDVWFPKVTKLGVRRIAIVVPQAVLGQMSMNRAHKDTISANDMVMEHFGNVEDATNWLKNC